MLKMTLLHGNNLDLLRAMPDNSVHAIVCDPPYGLGKEPDALAMLRDWIEAGHHDVKSKSGFMGKTWDAFVPQPVQWRECLRVLKPGGHVLSFAGTRTHDLITMGLRIAGFEIRDQIDWIYGQGFPKSLDVGKALDKMAGAEREVVGSRVTAPATEAAQQWDGWGTALKPALEPITLARKPLEGTVAANVLAHGTGALNIDGCRVETDDNLNGGAYSNGSKDLGEATSYATGVNAGVFVQPAGRWPANLIHDGSDEVVGAFPVTGPSNVRRPTGEAIYGGNSLNSTVTTDTTVRGVSDNGGSAARFFYCAKASNRDRGEGNSHPTVKPTDLMRYLCRLVTPPGGVVLDPFMGSGTAGVAAVQMGRQFIGIEREPKYFDIACKRIEDAQRMVDMFGFHESIKPKDSEQNSLL